MSRYAFSSRITAAVQTNHGGTQHHYTDAAYDQPAIQVNDKIWELLVVTALELRFIS